MVDSRSEILSYFTNRIQVAKEQQLTELDLSVPWNTHDHDQLEHIPEAVFELTQLEKLNLNSNGIKTIPESITKLTNLTSLSLSFNGIKTIPESITKLTNLVSLDLSFNEITDVPESISKLINLTSLDLRDSEIEIIPESISKLTNLTHLNFSRNGITAIPESIIRLTNLTSLNLSGNRIGSISIYQTLIKLTNLTSLNLSRNEITTIPESISKLINLTALDLSGNKITTIPESISNLTKLTHLDFSSCGIKNISGVIFDIANLTTLDLNSNSITSIPQSIADLVNLRILDLSANKLTTIPETLLKLTNLTELYLGGNKITTIPNAIDRLTNLTRLYLSDNEIKTIPDAINKLTNLTEFYLIENKIITIPDAISKLTNLTKLYLSGNRIASIPDSLVKLTNLNSLNLNFNGIITIPDAISKLTNLTKLYLSGNRIKNIPDTIVKLKNLTTLDLSDNEITSIPDAIAKLKNLTSLDLSVNKITNIPHFLIILTNLIELKLDFNPIETPPIEIIDKGIKSIRDYFLQLEAGQDYIYEAKLMILGEGGAGKTTLAKKISNPDYKLQQDEVSTEGIDIITWKFDLPKTDKKFQVNIWDFGGQEIYHATHQFFLTKRSLYVLVADTRKEDTDFYYWLNAVELLTDNSPILIINNEKQDRQREININALRGQFSNLKETLPTNLKTSRGLPDVITSIQYYIQELPHIGQVLPSTWVKVRQALEKDPRNYISLTEYLAICEVNGFTKFSDKLQLSRYLHDLGVCLHFQEEEDSILYKTVILHPQWGTDAVYKVLDNKQVINNQGRFSRDDLKNIWQEEQYVSMRGELLELMNKFKLCYEIPGNKNSFISPQLLRENQPQYDWNTSNNLILRYTYPDFMPKGIISHFIVVMHEYIEQQEYVWKSGIILKRNQAKAEVIEDYGKREIRIRVAGHNKRNFMTIITHELEQINNSFNKRLKYQKLIPCNCEKCKINNGKHFYDFTILNKFIQDKQREIQCQQSYKMVDVLSLIDDVMIRRDIEQLDRQQNQGDTHIKQIIYGNVGFATGNVARDQNITDTNIQGDRNINLDQGNYIENIEGEYLDQSSSVNISNNALVDISNEVADIINQLPNFDAEPDKKQLKELLTQLQHVVLQTELEDEDKEDTFQQIKAIASCLTNSPDSAVKKTAKRGMKMLRGTAAALPPSASMVTICNQLAELISKVF